MSKHTPGPWEVIGRFEDKVYHEPSDTVIAQAWYPGSSSKSPSPADTMKANARLIAATLCGNCRDGRPLYSRQVETSKKTQKKRKIFVLPLLTLIV